MNKCEMTKSSFEVQKKFQKFVKILMTMIQIYGKYNKFKNWDQKVLYRNVFITFKKIPMLMHPLMSWFENICT